MKQKINVLKKLRNYYKKVQEEKQAAIQEERRATIILLDRAWTEVQIKDYNCMLIFNSAGWIGGDYTERDIKASILRNSAHLFTEEEYTELYNKIYQKTKIKK
jgi:hypothetical protein